MHRDEYDTDRLILGSNVYVHAGRLASRSLTFPHPVGHVLGRTPATTITVLGFDDPDPAHRRVGWFNSNYLTVSHPVTPNATHETRFLDAVVERDRFEPDSSIEASITGSAEQNVL